MMSKDELLDILHASRRNNGEKAVTGMLLYKGGNFLQVLEGEEANILEVFKKIKEDPRHTDITILSQESIEKRQFANWEMAFVNLDDETIKNESAFSEFLRDEFTSEKYSKEPSLAHIMLLAFKKNIS